MTINDWTTLQTRKDVVTIKRAMTKQAPWNWSFVAEVFYVLLGFALDNIMGQTGTGINSVWVWIAIAGAVTPAIIVLLSTSIEKRKSYEEARIHSISYFVSLFDDEICYAVMTADSFCRSFIGIEDVADKRNHSLAEFYFIEANYYLAKAADALKSMSVSFSSVIDTTDKRRNRISISRFYNLTDIMLELYDELEQHRKMLWNGSVSNYTASVINKEDDLKDLRSQVNGLLQKRSN